jgi:hypothetical protein
VREVALHRGARQAQVTGQVGAEALRAGASIR